MKPSRVFWRIALMFYCCAVMACSGKFSVQSPGSDSESQMNKEVSAPVSPNSLKSNNNSQDTKPEPEEWSSASNPAELPKSSNGLELEKKLDALVFVLAGQSNALGAGYNATLSATYAAEYPLVKISVDGDFPNVPQSKFENLRSGFGRDYGSELSLGRRLSEAYPGSAIFIVKVAWGNTFLAATSAPSVPPTLNWFPGQGSLYTMLRDRVDSSLAALQKTHKKVTLKGLFWMQGESDATNPSTARAYEENLVNFICQLRGAWGVAKLPFVIGLVAAIPEWPFHEAVRAAQMRITMNPLTDNTRVVETSDLPRHPLDPYHFNGEGVLELGNRFASAFLQIASTDR